LNREGGTTLITSPSMVALVVAASAAQCQEPQQEVEILRETERERLRALVEADMDVAERLHAHDFQLINPVGAALSREQYLGGIASGDIDYLVWEPDSIEVRLYGDGAVIRYRARLEIVAFGQPMPLSQFWHTDAYEKRDGQWQVVWSQATEIR
jgi:hypothetical protein